MAKDTCENDLMINGPQDDLDALSAWIQEQTHDQAPTSMWAALYNLEKEVQEMETKDDMIKMANIYEGSPDHGYGVLVFKEFRNISDSDNGRIVFNFASKNDPCIRIVQLLAERYPRLNFDFGYVNFDTGENATVSFVNGQLGILEVGDVEEESDDDFFASEDEGSDDDNWGPDEMPW